MTVTVEPLCIAEERLPLVGIADPAIAHVYSLWNRRRGDRSMPARGEIHPEELAVALGKMNLITVLRDPLRFQFRVRGSTIAGLHDRDMTGHDVAELTPPEYRDMLIRHYTEAVERAAPILYRIRQSRDRITSEYRRLILPLGTAAGVVEMLLTVSAWGEDFARKSALLGFKR